MTDAAPERGEPAALPRAARLRLHAIARQAVEKAAMYQPAPWLRLEREPASLQAVRACFVTLYDGHRAHGFVGDWQPREALAAAVARHANRAATVDPRFRRPTREQAKALLVDIAVLQTVEPLVVADEADLCRQLQPEHDGLVLRHGDRQAVFLPAVWTSHNYTPTKFVTVLKQRIGLRSEAWADTVQAIRFTAEVF